MWDNAWKYKKKIQLIESRSWIADNWSKDVKDIASSFEIAQESYNDDETWKLSNDDSDVDDFNNKSNENERVSKKRKTNNGRKYNVSKSNN